MGDICGDNRFEIIAKAKKNLLESTNIHTSEDEMKVLDSFLFRCWQMGWLERYDKPREPLDIPTMTTEFVKEHGFPCPNGYEFKDENGNVINATKIVLEKKKKEYPKSYEECCGVMGVNHTNDLDICEHCDYKTEITYYEDSLLEKIEALYRLRICRDAYWKLYGEEIGLDKPWEPDWKKHQGKWVITLDLGYIVTGCVFGKNHILAFPTAEMRDAFKENFDPDIEFCKEFL